jgi:hypothetical protein
MQKYHREHVKHKSGYQNQKADYQQHDNTRHSTFLKQYNTGY